MQKLHFLPFFLNNLIAGILIQSLSHRIQLPWLIFLIWSFKLQLQILQWAAPVWLCCHKDSNRVPWMTYYQGEITSVYVKIGIPSKWKQILKQRGGRRVVKERLFLMNRKSCLQCISFQESAAEWNVCFFTISLLKCRFPIQNKLMLSKPNQATQMQALSILLRSVPNQQHEDLVISSFYLKNKIMFKGIARL